MKYKLTKNKKIYCWAELTQIQAVKTFAGIKAGDLGGWVEYDFNLDHNGNSWLHENAVILGSAAVCDDAQIYGNSIISGHARVYENAMIFDNAQVSQNAWVYGNAQMHDNSKAFGYAQIYGNSQLYDYSRVFGNAQIFNQQMMKHEMYYGSARPWWE